MDADPTVTGRETGPFNRLAQRALDTQRRAWLLCWGWVAEADEQLGFMPRRPVAGFGPHVLQASLNAAALTGLFPTVAIDWVPEREHVEQFESVYRVVTRTSWQGEPYLECQIGMSPEGSVGMALTRSGRFVDHGIGANSVLLSDLETLIVDTMVLLEAASQLLDWQGTCFVAADALCDIPGAPLRLCTLDSLPGGRPSPGRLVEQFEPVVLSYPRGLDLAAGHEVVWRGLAQVAAQFGASRPQVVPPVHSGARRGPLMGASPTRPRRCRSEAAGRGEGASDVLST